MRKVNKLLTILLTLVMLLPGFVKAVEAAEVEEQNSNVVERVKGVNRVDTSIKVSNEVYPDASAESVVLAGWDGQVDALTATLLASAKDAPLLLVRDSQYSNIKNELNRLGVTDVYIAGGTAVVSEKVERDLEKDGYKITRLSGENRYFTAAEIMKEADVNSNHVFLVNSGSEKDDQLADALSVGPVSGRNKSPILLTSKDKVPQATIDALKGVSQITIVGGEAVVSDKVDRELKDAGYKVDRVKGKNRHETAVEISKKYFDNSKQSIIVNDGKVSFADALVGGYLGAKKESPVLLTNANQLSDHTKDYVENGISFSYVLGGSKSISSNVFNNLDEAIAPRRNIETIETFSDVEVEYGGKYHLPQKVEIGLSDKEIITVPVEWYDKDVNVSIPGVYKVEGSLDFSGVRNLEEEAKNKMATVNIVIAKKIEVDKKPFRVVVDYGHGGRDPGTLYNGRREKDDTLRLGKMVTAELRRQGIVAEETRTGDYTVELIERTNFANRNGRDYYNYFISIHRNAFKPNTAQGSETFVYMNRNPLSVALATNIQKGLTEVGFFDRKVKEGNFYVLRNSYAPAVLVEVGFMDNDSDNKLFDNNLEQIAKSIADAVVLQSK